MKEDWVLVSPHRMKRPWSGQTENPTGEDDRPDFDPKNPLCPTVTRPSGAENPEQWPPELGRDPLGPPAGVHHEGVAWYEDDGATVGKVAWEQDGHASGRAPVGALDSAGGDNRGGREE